MHYVAKYLVDSGCEFVLGLAAAKDLSDGIDEVNKNDE